MDMETGTRSFIILDSPNDGDVRVPDTMVRADIERRHVLRINYLRKNKLTS